MSLMSGQMQINVTCRYHKFISYSIHTRNMYMVGDKKLLLWRNYLARKLIINNILSVTGERDLEKKKTLVHIRNSLDNLFPLILDIFQITFLNYFDDEWWEQKQAKKIL